MARVSDFLSADQLFLKTHESLHATPLQRVALNLSVEVLLRALALGSDTGSA